MCVDVHLNGKANPPRFGKLQFIIMLSHCYFLIDLVSLIPYGVALIVPLCADVSFSSLTQNTLQDRGNHILDCTPIILNNDEERLERYNYLFVYIDVTGGINSRCTNTGRVGGG